MSQKTGGLSATAQELWDTLEIRVVVLVSLFIQVVLITTGSRRKYRKNKFVTAIVWLFYLSADYIATTALGVLSHNSKKSSSADQNYAITAFWAPFLLMHLGGPDTITAYALADNQLWSRHLLGLVGQVGVAGYVLYKSWTWANINYLWIVIFVAGMVKYGERSWVLYSASKDRFRESMVLGPDPGPNYAKFMDELVSKEHEGYDVSLTKAIDAVRSVAKDDSAVNIVYAGEAVDEDAQILQEAYSLFGTFKKLFADLILSFQDKQSSLSFFTDDDMHWDKAFSIVEIELGLVYDLFYTKAFLLYSWLGFFLRILSCTFTVAASVGFLFIEKNIYKKSEVIITYILLVGAIFLEIYSVLLLISTDWVMIWLTGDWTAMPVLRKFIGFMVVLIGRAASGLRKLHMVPSKRRWSNAIGQYNILNCCLKGKRKHFIVIRQYVDDLFRKTASTPNCLKEVLFEELKRRVDTSDSEKLDTSNGDNILLEKINGRRDDTGDGEKLGNYRGDKILLEQINGIVTKDKDHEILHEVEFDQSLLLWHMATDLCYHVDVKEGDEPEKAWLAEINLDEELSTEDDVKFKREICRLLSNYMMHLMIMSPFMLPSGIGLIRFQDTCAEASEFCRYKKKKLNKREVCDRLSRINTRLAPSKVKGDRSKSLLFDACKLANSLQSEQLKNHKWEIITKAWLYLVTYAAAQCNWSDHAEKLSEGGELLTHVWLLMAHFGMTDHFQISQGYVRAKLQLV